MARTEDQIYAELAALFPFPWTENAVGRAIVRGVAKVFSDLETDADESGGWFDQMFRALSTGVYLTEHGTQANKFKRFGETDAAFRARAYMSPQIFTPAVAREELASVFFEEGYQIYIEEPYRNSLGNRFFLGHYSSILTDRDESPRWLFWLFMPRPELTLGKRFFLNHSFLDHKSALDEKLQDDDRYFKRAAQEIVRVMKAHGIAWGATIDDFPQLAYYDGTLS